MITMIIFAIVFAVAYLYRESYCLEFGDFVISIFLGFLGFIFGGMVAWILPEVNHIEKTTYSLELINDNNTQQGHFFLGTGNISGEMKFVYYYEENGIFKLNQVDYDKGAVTYEEGSPKVVKSELIGNKDAFINYFAFDINEPTYLFKVPKGSIKTGYNLDAK